MLLPVILFEDMLEVIKHLLVGVLRIDHALDAHHQERINEIQIVVLFHSSLPPLFSEFLIRRFGAAIKLQYNDFLSAHPLFNPLAKRRHRQIGQLFYRLLKTSSVHLNKSQHVDGWSRCILASARTRSHNAEKPPGSSSNTSKSV